MTLIKGFKDKEEGFNGDTLRWKDKPLNEMNKKQLIDIIVQLFQINLALQQEMKQHKRILS
jgi:hypothetical protein